MPLFLVLILPCHALAFQQKTVTLYLDGAKVEVVEKSRQGYLELPLPAAMIPGSLRVAPLDGSVDRVEVVTRSRERRGTRQKGRLEARRAELEDRLKALAVREEVFTAAAKSQSGKSLKKTKTNPDPVTAARQGTEFALGQLEGIFRARRKCEAELKEIDGELSLKRLEGTVARVWLTGKRARLSWLTKGEKWSPAYSFRADGSRRGEVLIHAKLPPAEEGVRYLVAPGTLATAPPGVEPGGDPALVSRRQLVLEKEAYSELPYPTLAISFTGGEKWWPAGEAVAFWRGAYVGAGQFAGGGGGEVVFGR